MESIRIGEFADSSKWKLFDSISSGKQVFHKLVHVNPEIAVDPDRKDFKVINEEKRGNVIETTISAGIKTLKASLSDSYESMKVLVQMGCLPQETLQNIEKLRGTVNAVPPEGYDYMTDITVAEYNDKDIAFQALKNLSTQFTKGIANMLIPGAPNGMTVMEVFENPLVKEAAKKQGFSEEMIQSTMKKLKDTSAQMEKDAKNSDVRYEIGLYGKYPCIYVYPHVKSRKKKKDKRTDRVKEIRREDGSVVKIQASGGVNTMLDFPKDAFKREDLPIDGRMLQALQVGKYIISGGLLTTLNCMPSGKSFCQSLTKYKTVTEIFHEGGMTYITKWIVPLNSCLKDEGYMYREEVEKMINTFISLL